VEEKGTKYAGTQKKGSGEVEKKREKETKRPKVTAFFNGSRESWKLKARRKQRWYE